MSVGPCHDDMERPRVADGGDGLYMWRVAANTFNKQSRTADKGKVIIRASRFVYPTGPVT
jgi:hypothetical protein